MVSFENVGRAAFFAFTVPAILMAPPNNSSFSVNVVLPASGCEMMAKVRRRSICRCSSDIWLRVLGGAQFYQNTARMALTSGCGSDVPIANRVYTVLTGECGSEDHLAKEPCMALIEDCRSDDHIANGRCTRLTNRCRSDDPLRMGGKGENRVIFPMNRYAMK